MINLGLCIIIIIGAYVLESDERVGWRVYFGLLIFYTELSRDSSGWIRNGSINLEDLGVGNISIAS